jgi:transcriptional regulator with GAF, ATPase, and Fis domain
LASQEQESVLDLSPLSLNLLAEQEVAPRAKVFARFVSELIADAAVSVYTLATAGEKTLWVPRATVGEAKLHNDEIPAESGLLRMVFTESAAITRRAAEVKREDYPHIDIRKSLLSLTYLPLIHNENLIGALEILAFEEEISANAAQALLPAAEVAAAAISTAQAYEEERNGTMTSITRLTQLYDLEKVFSSTLEMDDLLPLIGTKLLEILECQAGQP